jgi:CrcB protein
MNILIIGLGGFIGACARFGVGLLAEKTMAAFPLGTLLANVIAGFAIGLIIGIERASGALDSHVKVFLTTGLLGGLSTFSTFSLETVQLIERQQYGLAAGNVLVNVGVCLAAVAAGQALGVAFFLTRLQD